VWEHSPGANWALRREGDHWFAQETGLGNASGPARWTAQGTLRIDYVTRDGSVTGYYDMRFNPDGFTADGRVEELTGPKRRSTSHWRRITIHSPDLSAAPTPVPSSTPPPVTAPAPTPIPAAKPNVLVDSGNIGGVYNLPTRPTVIRIAQDIVLTSITNYHWNNGRGTPQTGTIALRDAAGRTYGPWPTTGRPGQGGVPNAYWTATPQARVPAGDYTVIDSDPNTWAQNSQSGGAGHTRFDGYPVSGSSSGPVAVVVSAPASPTRPTQTPAAPLSSPTPAASTVGAFDGNYAGKVVGDDGEDPIPIRFTIRGQQVQGGVNGNFSDGDQVTATLSGTVNAHGQISIRVQGTVQWRFSSQAQYSTLPFSGQLTGTVQGRQITGRWTASSPESSEKSSGSWTASR
jgi:hypothetical protein